jgi:hypothetical protein
MLSFISNRRADASSSVDREPKEPQFSVIGLDRQLMGMISREDVRRAIPLPAAYWPRFVLSY